jgi:hypothetical protein
MKISGLVILFFLFCACATAQEWMELKGTHFIVYFTGANDKFAKEALDKAEVYYNRIASDLGYQRYSEFWTWDKRVKIYIYAQRDSFLKATSQPDWSQGMADYTNKQIISYSWSSGFLDFLLPHEIAHLVFRDFVGFKGEVPLWLDEGVAQWTEPAKRQQVKAVARQLLNRGALISLQDMMKLDIRNISSADTVRVHIISAKEGAQETVALKGSEAVNVYYIQSVSLVSFLTERYGFNSFTEFCRQLRDGKSLDKTLSFAYSAYMHNLGNLKTK